MNELSEDDFRIARSMTAAKALDEIAKMFDLDWQYPLQVVGIVKYHADELALKNKKIELAITTLRMVVHDRPTAHTDEVWEKILTALSELETQP